MPESTTVWRSIMPEHSVVLDFGGTRVLVRSNARPWIDKMVIAFAPLVADNATVGPPDFALTINENTIPAPVDCMPLTWEGTQTDGHYGRIFETESAAVLEVEDGGVVIIDHDTQTASAHFKPGAYSKFFGSAVMLIVDAALASGGQQLVHAACLVEKRSGRAILVSAPSGGGKTTTALTLAHSGFSLMTDDASVVIPDSNLARAWGLPRALKVHRQTAKMLPWLGPLPDIWDDAGEQGVTLERLSDLISIANNNPVELAAIFQLGPRSQGAHKISPVGKSEILIGMAHENVAWRPAGMVPKAVQKFDVLAQMISQVSTYSLSAGTDLASLPALVSDAINGSTAINGIFR